MAEQEAEMSLHLYDIISLFLSLKMVIMFSLAFVFSDLPEMFMMKTWKNSLRRKRTRTL